MLYVSVGDGGGGGDPCNTGQNLQTHLGKILRIDVAADGNPDSTTSCGSGSSGCNNCVSLNDFDYTVPADNPFVDDPEVDDAIYAYGMRNPWRFAFDYETERLYAGDVGQGDWEEVDSIIAGGNYGWSTMEGNHCFGGNACDTSAAPGEANSAGMTAPIAEYARSGGRCSVTGLGVYRSCEVPGFAGLYFYADLCTGEVFAVNYDGTTSEVLGPVATIPNNQGAFGGGYNAHGDVFIVSGNYFGGNSPAAVYRITAAK
jgi:glucose/arabinose dehydrogenase